MMCHSCHVEFEDYKSLALHIISSKKEHRKGKKWAARFLAQVNKKEFSPRMPMSEETKEILKECVRSVSGRYENIKTICPSCKSISHQNIEVEFIRDTYSWRNPLGTLVVNCLGCRRQV